MVPVAGGGTYEPPVFGAQQEEAICERRTGRLGQ
jgi:hypothetical protein